MRNFFTGLLTILLFLGIAPGLLYAQDTDPCGDTVTIVAGDTLSEIALRCNTTVEALVAANPGVDPRALRIGAVLNIPDETLSPQDEPLLAVTPTIGGPGTVVEIIGNGFPPDAEIDLGVGRPGSEYDLVSQARTSEAGTVATRVTIPDFIGDDAWVIVVVTPDNTVSAVAPTEEPMVAISATEGMPETTLAVIANGFPAETPVDVGVGRRTSEYTVVESLLTNAAGAVQTEATIPADAELGEQWVIVVETEDQSVFVTSAVFEITETEAIPPSDAPTFTRADMYLIALEDGGETGEEIGCGDSVLPVEIAFESTVAPLTAALEQLLGLESEFYGQSGLYNALYQSDLTLEGINIEDGHATISLSGTLRLGGACDEPRVQAQIEQTALQYNTVDSVTILVNGEPL